MLLKDLFTGHTRTSVIAVSCTDDVIIPAISTQLHRLGIECLSFLNYSRELFFKTYFQHDERVPLLFILSTDDVALVHNLGELLQAESRLKFIGKR